jgi:hypothetical protein
MCVDFKRKATQKSDGRLVKTSVCLSRQTLQEIEKTRVSKYPGLSLGELLRLFAERGLYLAGRQKKNPGVGKGKSSNGDYGELPEV